MVEVKDNRMTFKVDRPSFMTKSNFVDSILNERQQINSFFCTNLNPDSMQVELIIRHFINNALRKKEADKIYGKVAGWMTKELNAIKVTRGDLVKEGDESHARNLAWLSAYQEANELIDRYYRVKGNEVKISVIGRYGSLPSHCTCPKCGHEFERIEKNEIEFADADLLDQEAAELQEFYANGGGEQPAS